MKQFMQFLVALFLLSEIVNAQDINVNSPLPIDANIRTGKLPNGIKYYIRKNLKPEKRAELRLALNAGSLYETDGQQGLAHFVEHMCFNGTKNFPKNDLVNYLELLGIKFGPELNAYTSFGETVYMLKVPTDKQDIIEKSYQVLEDWAHNVSFDSTEIEKERGVILEEWRLGLGADDRMSKIFYPIIFKDSKYAKRLPIGLPEIIKSFHHDTLRAYYKTWYRPDLMAVIAVGDFDVDEQEKLIKAHFSGLKNPEKEKKRTEYTLPDNTKPIVAITKDKEASEINISIFCKKPHLIEKTIGDYRKATLRYLFNEMISGRLTEINQRPDCPFTYSYSYYGNFFVRTTDALVGAAGLKENKTIEGFSILLTELERAKRFGFTETELERAKKNVLTWLENAAKEADKTESGRLADEYIRNFLKEEPIPGIKAEYAYVQKFCSEIAVKELNNEVKNWITDENLVILLTAPEKEGLKIPTETELLETLKNVKNSKIEAYVDNVSNEPLIPQKPKGSKVKTQTENKDFAYTELTLENGAKVILKSTDFKNNEIQFSAFSSGGSSMFADADIASVNNAANIISQCGLANNNLVALNKKLAGTSANIYPYISDIRDGLQGNTTPKDMETLLQLCYLYFTQPRKDNDAFTAFISKASEQMKFMKADPQNVYMDTLIKTLASNSPRELGFGSEKSLKTVSMDKVFSIFTDRFQDASDWTFIFVGSFKNEEVIPLIETYIGAIPAKNRKETWKNVNPKFPTETKEIVVKAGTEPKSSVALFFSEPFTWDATSRLHLDMIGKALNIKLRESMREDKGGVYGVRCSLGMSKSPDTKYTLRTMWGCDPARVDELVKTVFDEISKMIANGPTKEDLEKVQAGYDRELEQAIKQNNYWVSKIDNYYFNGDKIVPMEETLKAVHAVTIDDLKNTAQKLLNPKHYVKVVLLPKN